MNKYIFPNFTKSIKIQGTDVLLPIGKVYCLGKNYKDHAKEMNESNINEPPFFFSKPPQSLTNTRNIEYPLDTNHLQYEVELVVYIGKKCKSLCASEVKDCIMGYSVGIDLTKRDHQKIAKQKRQPWDLSKGFDNSAPVSEVHLSKDILSNAAISLKLNGKIKQSSNISKMTWDIAEIIAFLSNKITLYPGDVIFTGTPSGVGDIKVNDQLEACIEGIGTLNIGFI